MSITAEEKTKIIKDHGRGKDDTGSPEVQIGLLTARYGRTRTFASASP